jgi:ABC-type glycerol-3-phosphate transport system substrate-binding protein
MKKIALIALMCCVVLVTVVLAVIAVVVRHETESLDSIPLKRSHLLSDDAFCLRQFNAHFDVASATEMEDGTTVAVGQKQTFTLNVSEEGLYQIALAYCSGERSFFDNPVRIKVGEQEILSNLSFLWAEDVSQVSRDRYGNQTLPDQHQLPFTLSWVEERSSFSGRPVIFSLASGKHDITLMPQNQAMTFFGIYVIKTSLTPSYSQYCSILSDVPAYDGECITIEGEAYRAKSDSSIRGTSVPNVGLSPYNPYVKLINATSDKSNKTVGQKIHYEITVPRDGIYNVSMRYSQPQKVGGYSYRTLEIDGSVPFQEMHDIGFPYTGINTYKNMTVGGDEPFGLFLTKGTHILTLKVTAEPVEAAHKELLLIVDEINDTGISLRRIKGNNSMDSSSVDVNRTWDVLQYIPDLLTRIDGWCHRLESVYEDLKVIGGAEPAYVADIMLAVQNLRRLSSNPRELINKLNLLSDDSSSAAQLISLSLSKICEQNLSIDCIYIHGAGERLPSATPSFVTRTTASLKQFVYSFSKRMNETVDVKSTDDNLTVWINKPAQYVDVLRELTAEDFTKQSGINVSFSIMPDEKKITLANSTGNNPDLALGLSYYRPAEFAMRGMAVNLLEFDDFLDWYGDEYNIEALSPMAYENGIYGASETQDFYVLFYRKDILDMLGLDVPDTWDDVKGMMPTLHRNAMNFNLPLANNVGYKSFEATGGFIFQNGGNYYSDDGMSSNFGDPNTIKGFREMVELYQVYGLAQNIPNFFNAFRSGSVPIGVSNFSTYLQLQIGAPELNGRWDIALVPGTKQEDGSLCRYWSADMTSTMIFANSKKIDEAYLFMKWWLSSEVQLRYADELQLKLGPEYIWNTGNHEALVGLPYPVEHKHIILEQWSWQKEALRHPASYILEREVSNAWISIVTEGDGFQSRVDEATLNSNREIRRKLTEFGYYDGDGNQIRDYNIHLIDELKSARGGDDQ